MLIGIDDDLKKVGNGISKDFPLNLWFDEDCKRLNSTVKSKNISNEHRPEIQRESRSAVQRKKRLHYQNIAYNLEDMYFDNPTEYKH